MSSKLITPESPLLVPPLLAAEIGLPEAMILQQIHYFCQISKHIKQDGRRWFWKTLQDWGQTLPFLKISTIRRAIANLRNFQLIDVCRHSQKTWYQANWFTVNVENVEALWDRICQNQQIDVSPLNVSNCSPRADQIKEFTPKEFASQQHVAAVEKKDDEAGRRILEEETKISEQTQITHFVDEPELVNSTSEIDFHEDSFSAAAAQPVEKSSQAVSPLPVQGDRYVDESELDDLAQETNFDESQVSEAEVEADTDKPSKYQIKEICTELRRLRINPQPCLGVVKKHWGNVRGAIARVKDAIAEGWCDNPTGLFINSCKSGAKGKNTVTTDVSKWFEWARRQRIVLAMSGNVVYTPDGEAVELQEMMRRFPVGE